jgi:hypothetical protein
MRQAQTGNRVYRGVGTSPNMGPVSAKGAQGYIKRELNKPKQGGRPVGRDGKSDSRSGIAGRVLNNNLAQHGGRAPVKKNPPKQKGVQSNIPQPQTQVNPVGSGAGSTPVQPQIPQIKVNANGMLELPYSQNLSQGAMQALQGANDELMSLQAEEQDLQRMIAQGRRDADLQYGDLKKSTLNTNASGGTAYSSMYAKGVADNATAYSNTLADLSSQETDAQQQFSNRRASIQNSLSQQLAALAQEEADRLNEDAGDLGYGDYSGETHSHDDNSPNRGNRGNKGKKKPPKKNEPPKKNPPKKGKK